MRRTVTAAVVATCLATAVAGCGRDDHRTLTELKPGPSASASTPTLSPHRTLLTFSPRYRTAISNQSCSRPDLSSDDTACGAALEEAASLAPVVVEFVRQGYDITRYPKLPELAGQVTRSVGTVRSMGCFGMGPAPKRDTTGMCPTFARIANLAWLALQSTADQI